MKKVFAPDWIPSLVLKKCTPERKPAVPSPLLQGFFKAVVKCCGLAKEIRISSSSRILKFIVSFIADGMFSDLDDPLASCYFASLKYILN